MTRGLTGRLLAVSGIVLLLCAGTFALVWHNVNQLREAVRELRVSNQRINTGKELLKLVVDLETGLRGYVITHHPKFLEPTIAGQQAIPDAEQDFLNANAVSISALALEEFSFRRHPRGREIGRMLFYAAVENLGYRQLTDVWRGQAFWDLARRKRSWGEMTRRGFQTAPRDQAG